jgi:hypothetical protein
MHSYHSYAVEQSALLFDRAFANDGLSAEPNPEDHGPDLVILHSGTTVGLGEVKTLVNQERTKLASELYGKNKRRFSTDLPKGSGLWSLQVEPGADIRNGHRLVEQFFSDKRRPQVEDIVLLQKSLDRLGFQFLRRHPDSASDGLILNPAPTLFSPIEWGVNPDKLCDFFWLNHSHKEAVLTVQNYSGAHRHLFLWPCESEFPGEVFAANDFPAMLPKPLEQSLRGFTHLWIGHKYSANNDVPNAWMYSEETGWKIAGVPNRQSM